MTEDRKPAPHRTPEGRAATKRRESRLAAALRNNLARRKAQARQRQEAGDPDADPAKRG
jgi:hypothetical protein